MTKPDLLKDQARVYKINSIKFTKVLDLDILIETIHKIYLNMLVDEKDDKTARDKFYQTLRINCSMEYETYLGITGIEDHHINWTCVAVHIILYTPLSVLTYLLSERQEHSSNSKKLILSICNCLNEKNRKYLNYLSLKDCTDHLNAKSDMLQEFLERQSKDLPKLSTYEGNINNAENLFFRECVELFGVLLLPHRIENLLNHLEGLTYYQKERAIDSDVTTDGNIYEQARDPPGQRCIYIPPGNNHEESYRLSTFLKYPTDSPVNPRGLAASGFYFTGYKDRVKCFSCGNCVENWVRGDDVTDIRWHKFDCKMMLNEESGNVAMLGLFSRFSNRSNPPNERSPTSSSVSQAAVAHPPVAASTQANMQSAGQILMQGLSNYVPPRPVQQLSPNRYPSIELATIVSPHHENLIKNLDLNKESERKKTFQTWHQVPFTVDPADLARSGFFFLGNADRVQCFSCGGVLRSWKPQDNVDAEHKKHFPHCRMVIRADGRNVPLNSNQAPPNPQPPANPMEEPPNPSSQERERLERMFPCLNGVNPHMREELLRLQTFDYRWPSTRVRATPSQIAKAGFYFLGERDRVKCWYCNGGLQNWEPMDEPWREHAKWFPTCEFVLKEKGPDFVHSVVAANPNLNRPFLRGPYDVPPSHRSGIQHRRPSSPPPPIIDHKAIRRKIQQELPKAMESEIVKELEKMGFESNTIRHCVKRKLKQSGRMQGSIAELLDDVTGEISSSSDEDETQPSKSQKIPTEASSSALSRSATSSPASSLLSLETAPPASAETRMKQIQDERQCKVCLDKEADIVFVPCGHLVCCINCAASLRRCPICRAKIDKAIKTYVS